ncbi:hypothetical protein GGH13_009115 [Coemansia sp. S155-1]|nr:hypothetical protein GGH13_009115 [Coemansia sp. S155-1]
MSAFYCAKAVVNYRKAGLQIEASIYDGHTRYKSSAKAGQTSGGSRAAGIGGHLEDGDGHGSDESDEDEDEEEQRMEKYSQWLEAQE